MNRKLIVSLKKGKSFLRKLNLKYISSLSYTKYSLFPLKVSILYHSLTNELKKYLMLLFNICAVS